MRSDPVFEPLQPLLAGCVPPGLALYFVRPGQLADLSLSWGEPPHPAGPLFVLGSETLVLVVHPTNQLASLSQAVLQQVYAGKFNNWDPIGGKDMPLTAWAYPAGEAIQNIFDKDLLQPAILSAQIHTSPGPRELRAAVSADPGGLGFLPRRWLDGSVRELPISGVDPTAQTRPLLAESDGQPQGGAKDFLLCLQEDLKTH